MGVDTITAQTGHLAHHHHRMGRNTHSESAEGRKHVTGHLKSDTDWGTPCAKWDECGHIALYDSPCLSSCPSDISAERITAHLTAPDAYSALSRAGREATISHAYSKQKT